MGELLKRYKELGLPENMGKCFDATALQMLEEEAFHGAVLCHGIGVASVSGQEGKTISHAWIEMDGYAYDCVFMAKVPADKYRADLRASYVVQYSFEEMLLKWALTNMPGPWDEKILAVSEEEI